MNYLLDFNACIALINGDPVSVRRKFDKARTAGDQIFISSIAVFELWYGVFKSSRVLFNTNRVVTANVSEFSRVKGLLWQDWART